MINLTITPQHAARLEGHDNELHALVRVIAAEHVSDVAAKPPLNLSIVIDHSGSMRGQPLHEAKRAAVFLVQNLRPCDRVSIVSYADHAQVLISGRPVGDGMNVRSAIQSIEPAGSTALHDGWMAGVEQAALMREPEQMGRVLLLSDGHANRGVYNPAILAHDAARIAATGITTTTCGLGANFDELLMLEMARAGQGSAYYGERAEDLIDPFREELELLSNLLARRLRLSLTPGEGVELMVLNGYRQDEAALILPDLAEGGEAWAMVRLRFSEGAEQLADRLLISAFLNFETMNGERATAGPTSLRLPRLPAGAFAALAVDETVTARRQELQAADIQDQARQAARARHWPEVDRLLAEAEREAGNNKWVAESLDSLKRIARRRDVEGFSKESVFAAQKMRSRLAATGEVAPSEWSASTESARAAYLRKKPVQGRRFDQSDDEPKR